MSLLIPTVRPGYFGQGSVEVTPAASADEGPVRRLAITSDQLVTRPREGVETIYDILQYSTRTYPACNAVAWRDVLSVHEEKKTITRYLEEGEPVKETKTWIRYGLSDYKFLTYVEFEERIAAVAAALVDLGFEAGDIFNIFAQTSVNWQIIAHACASISTTISTAYDTLGASGLTHSLNEPSCIGIFTNADLLATVAKVLPNTPSIKYVFYDDTPPSSVLASITSAHPTIRVFSIPALLVHGRSVSQNPEVLAARRPTSDTLACIMYTSGSTGLPKGVCLSHGNLVASIGSICTVFGHHLLAGSIYLAYLPLAHVLEYIVELAALYVGITSGYARVRTLTGAGVVPGCLGDLQALKPHIMFGVPTVWEGVKKGILGQVEGGGWMKKLLFGQAMESKKGGGLFAWLLDRVVLGKVREATGGNLYFSMNGGAAVSKETQEFMSLAVAPVMQGYGLTETCGMCTLLPPEMLQYGVAGVPVPSVEIKLMDVPGTEYASNALDGLQRGEICIRGPSVTKGYYKRPDLNNDETVFTKDGWFRTGDVGQWNEDGTLSIIDRIKNLVKLQNGEYIALERLEAIYKSCSLVANICVHASPSATQPIGIIVPHEINLRQALVSSPEEGQRHHDLASLCGHPLAKSLILSECGRVAERAGFKRAEMLKGVVLSPEEWTPETGIVTPAMKVQRAVIARVFKSEIEEAYADDR